MAQTLEQKRAALHAYYLKNRERIIKRQKQYRIDNPDRVAAIQKRYREDHKEEVRAQYLAYLKANPEKRRATIARSVFKCRWNGFTHDDRDALLASQGGRCACCGDLLLRHPQVDHCHRTGRIRGILCRNCNLTLGCAKDDLARLRSAITYLMRANEANI